MTFDPNRTKPLAPTGSTAHGGESDTQIAHRVDQICDDFESAWQSGQASPIEDYLSRWTSGDASALLQELLALELDLRRQRGEAVEQGEYIRRFPAHRRIVEAVFSSEASSGNPDRADRLNDPAIDTFAHVSDPQSSVHDRATGGGRFGRYELMGELARGGMGVVYKARQIDLNRIVALKMIASGQLASQEELSRFQREAEAAASLKHPGIVPIYDIGQGEGGQHFFSMAYIAGRSLSETISDGPMPSAEAARLLRKICSAVAYAHEEGVVHRDLKPGNVLLDEDGEPHVTDFGLAKRIEVEAELTTTGQVLGTPSYMPPEQAQGDTGKIGPPSDVYALGAVLYAVLCGRPPFQAASALDTLRQVAEQEPISLRQLNPSVDSDLETIALKCLEKDPVKRYASAAQLGDDLSRYLEGVPIEARPVGPLERGWRWCRRNRLVVSLAAACLLTLIAGFATSTWLAVQATRQARIASDNEARANANAKQAQAAKLSADRQWRKALSEKARADQEASEATQFFTMARDAVDQYFTRVSDDQRLRSQGLEALRRELLATARDFYEQLAELRGDDPQLQLERMRAHWRLALITEQVAGVDQAIAAYQRAIEIGERLARSHPQLPQLTAELAAMHGNRGMLLRQLARNDEARRALETAFTMRRQLAAEHPRNAGYINDVAQSIHLLALLGPVAGQPNGGAAPLSGQIGRQQADSTANALPRDANDFPNIAQAAPNQQPADEPKNASQTAPSVANQQLSVSQAAPQERPSPSDRPASGGMSKKSLYPMSRPRRGGHPTLPRPSGGMSKGELVQPEAPSTGTTPSRRSFADAVPPAAPQHQPVAQRSAPNLSQSVSGASMVGAAADGAIHEQPRPAPSSKLDAGAAEGALQLPAEPPRDPEAGLEMAIRIYDHLTAIWPDHDEYQLNLAAAHNNRGISAFLRRDLATAEHHYGAAERIHRRLARENPSEPDRQYQWGTTQYNLANVFARRVAPGAGATESTRRAEQLYGEARDRLEVLVGKHPDVFAYRASLADCVFNLGSFYWGQQRFDEAENAYARAIQLRETLVELQADVVEYGLQLAATHFNLASLDESRARPLESLTQYAQAVLVLERQMERSGTIGSLASLRSRLRREAPRRVALVQAWSRSNPQADLGARDWRGAEGVSLGRALLLAADLHRAVFLERNGDLIHRSLDTLHPEDQKFVQAWQTQQAK